MDTPDNPEAPIRRAAKEAVKAAIPDTPDLSTLPVRVDRRTGAELVTKFFFPLSPRTLEVWPLTWQHVNGYAVCKTAELFDEAQAKLDAAPPIRGGRRPKAEPEVTQPARRVGQAAELQARTTSNTRAIAAPRPAFQPPRLSKQTAT